MFYKHWFSVQSQVARLRLTILALLATIIILICNQPEAARTSLANSLNIDHGAIRSSLFGHQSSGKTKARGGSLKEHPIKTLSRKAEVDFDALIKKQSHTLKRAQAEYAKRYGRPPPPGFGDWFEYAKAQKSLIIDEFDMIDEALRPYFRTSGAEIAKNVQQIATNAAFTWSCKVESGRLHDDCEALGEETMALLRKVGVHIPDVQFVGNQFDEPRILLSQTAASLSMRTRRETQKDDKAIEWTDVNHRDVWSQLAVDRCDGFEAAKSAQKARLAISSGIDTLGISLVQNLTDSMDLCSHPEYKHLHGFWESPESFRYTDSVLPILTPAVPSTMNDVPFPAIAYTMSMYSYDESEVLDYSQKKPGLYWAGKTTGGFQRISKSNDRWIPLHRQRFVAVANDLDQEVHTYLKRSKDTQLWSAVESKHFNHDSYHVHFTDVVQCEEAACTHQKQYFNITPPDARGEAAKHTLVFDADGNGHSARYYRLLKSKSLPLKQTMFREWHDERLQPWLHFVPISLQLQELPEVVRYFVEEEEGRALAQEMATKGRDWAMKVLRPVDQVIYLYRLLLELARLQDQDRKAEQV